jgi:glycosyltransferase involved in cell wall biosynthesis
MRVSVIIPTYNNAVSLSRCLRTALNLDYPSDLLEILVIDNESTDGTAKIVRELQVEPRASGLRYLQEGRLEASQARHVAAKVASGELLLFTDDDATLSPQWATEYASAFNAHPEMAAAGGPIHAAWEIPPPRWLTEFMERKEPLTGGEHAFGPFSLLDRSDELLIEPRGYFYSVNMAIRRNVLFELGGFNPDMCEGKSLGDGESGLVFKLWGRDLLIGYVPDAEVHHHVGPERMTVGYLRHRMANQGRCNAYSEFHPKVPSRRALAGRAVMTAARAARRTAKVVHSWNRTGPTSLLAQMYWAQDTRFLGYTIRLIVDTERRALVEREKWLEARRHD